SAQAAQLKGIISAVAGDADILLVPDIEAGNMIYKELTWLAGASMAGLVLGTRVPVLLTSRADSAAARINSCAVAALYGRWLATAQPAWPGAPWRFTTTSWWARGRPAVCWPTACRPADG